MIKNNWKDKKEDVRSLYLDLKNPRIPKKNRIDEISVLKYLLEYENVLEIAKNIAKEGYHHSAVSIVCEENGKKIVLDGNRRLTACKLLLNPKLSPQKKYIKIFESLQSDINKDDFKNIKITIAPNRCSAEKEIWDIHQSSLMRKWQVIQKLRKQKDLVKNSSVEDVALEYGVSKNVLLKDLIKLSFYERISEKLTTKDDQDKLLKIGFNKIEKILVPEHGEKFLGYKKNNSTGEIIVENKEKFKKNLDKIQNDILTNSELRAACIKKEIEDRFVAVDKSYSRITNGDKNLPNPNHPDLFGNKNSNFDAENNLEEKPEEKTDNNIFNGDENNFVDKTDISDNIYDHSIYSPIKDRNSGSVLKNINGIPIVNSDKIKAIFNELKFIKAEKSPMMTAMNIRILLDITTKELLSLANKSQRGTLKERMKRVAKDIGEKKESDKDLRELIEALEKDFFTKKLNEIAHNTIFQISEDEARIIWKNVKPFFDFAISKMIKFENKK